MGGMGSLLVGSALYSFAGDFSMDGFEHYYTLVYGAIAAHAYAKDVYLGVFSDLANVFLVWCAYTQYGHHVCACLKKYTPNFLLKTAKQVASAASPKMGSKKRGRSKTPARKSQ